VFSDDQPCHLRAFGKLAVFERIAGFELDEVDDGNVVFFKLRAMGLDGRAIWSSQSAPPAVRRDSRSSVASRRDRPFGTCDVEIHLGLQGNFDWELTGSNWMCQIATWLRTDVFEDSKGE
jgi:hypothetical protein